MPTTARIAGSRNISGTLSRVNEVIGLGYLFARDLAQLLPFRFQDVAGYHGETAKEFGLKEGAQLKVELGEDGTVRSVELIK